MLWLQNSDKVPELQLQCNIPALSFRFPSYCNTNVMDHPDITCVKWARECPKSSHFLMHVCYLRREFRPDFQQETMSQNTIEAQLEQWMNRWSGDGRHQSRDNRNTRDIINCTAGGAFRRHWYHLSYWMMKLDPQRHAGSRLSGFCCVWYTSFQLWKMCPT
jgi:hypothetical protein